MSRELQPPVSQVKIELPTVIKNELPESEIGIHDIPDVKDIDIVYHPVCEESIKRETLESKHCKSVETQVSVNAENSPFIKTENITQRNKTEDTSDENVTKGTGQVVVEVQGSNEYSNVLSKLETDTLVLNFSKDLNNISTRARKAKQPEKTNFAKCHKTVETTSWEKDKEKIKVIKAPVSRVKAHDYTSLAENKYVCNHCQRAFNKLKNLKVHIRKMHREVTTMYQCPYCPYKLKWKYNIKQHIIQKHKDTKEWFQLHCNKCDYKTYNSTQLNRHKLVHLKPEDIPYFYCYHCSYKCQRKDVLKSHIFGLHVKQRKRHHCDKCDFKTYTSTSLKRHNLVHLKPEEIEYFCCYHCSYKSKHKQELKKHIFRHHFKNVKLGKRYGCNECDYEGYTTTELKNHKLHHLKPEQIQYFYCYHCSYKAKQKGHLKEHIFRHFKKEQVEFDCYICNFMTPKRELIIKHIKKHSKVQNKSEINEGS